MHTPTASPPPLGPVKPRLLDRVRSEIRLRHYSPRTEATYVRWIRRFILFHDKRHPAELGGREVERFLSWLAEERKVSASTQTQALSAVLFLYRYVLGYDLPWMTEVVRAPARSRLPVVLTRDEVRGVLRRLQGIERLLGMLLYGSGLRLLEALQLRVKDIDFDQDQILVRGGKGDRDRVTMLAQSVKAELRRHICIRAVSSGRWRLRCGSRDRPSGRPVTASGIHLRPTCWRMGTTSGRCRSCWGMRM